MALNEKDATNIIIIVLTLIACLLCGLWAEDKRLFWQSHWACMFWGKCTGLWFLLPLSGIRFPLSFLPRLYITRPGWSLRCFPISHMKDIPAEYTGSIFFCQSLFRRCLFRCYLQGILLTSVTVLQPCSDGWPSGDWKETATNPLQNNRTIVHFYSPLAVSFSRRRLFHALMSFTFFRRPPSRFQVAWFVWPARRGMVPDSENGNLEGAPCFRRNASE